MFHIHEKKLEKTEIQNKVEQTTQDFFLHINNASLFKLCLLLASDNVLFKESNNN